MTRPMLKSRTEKVGCPHPIFRNIAAAAGIAIFLISCRADTGDQAKLEKTAKNKAKVLEEQAADQGHGSPFPPPGAIGKKEVQAVDKSGKEPMDDAITCLARTIYWETRGSSDTAMEAIADVVMNRLGHEGFPKTICGVVKQGSEEGACQFSWWCDGLPDSAQEKKPYMRAKEIARKALNRQLRDRTGGALYFHRQGLKPDWSKQYIRTAKVGEHIFYKPADGKAK
jgi:spore germination cell wall hydrolase CwlJ-like protein